MTGEPFFCMYPRAVIGGGFVIQRKHHQKSKTGVSVAQQKGLMSSKHFLFIKNKYSVSHMCLASAVLAFLSLTQKGVCFEPFDYNDKYFKENILVFFQNEEILVQLDELDELGRITHAWIWLNCSITQAQKTVWCNG